MNDLDKILKDIYDSNFFDVKVSLKDNILNIFVQEKPIIENIKYRGLKSNEIKEDIFNKRILKQKSSFDETTLKKDRDEILNILKERGYYFAKLKL